MGSSVQHLCSTVEIDGTEYKINTDFKIWIEIEHLIFNYEREQGRGLAEILILAYPILPKNPIKAVERILWFYSAGREMSVDEAQNVQPVYDLKEDFDYVWGGFWCDFGIDLTETDMHWWKFRALLECLSENCKFSQIVGYRATDTSRIKDRHQRAFYEKMKKRFRLKGSFTEESLEKQLTDSLEGFFQ